MSRSGAPSSVDSRHDAARAVFLAPWHAACILALHGCFYVKPIPRVDVNEPPAILAPRLSPQPVAVTGATVRLTIRASDPEQGPVYFEWPDLDNVPHEPSQFQNGPVEISSMLVLEPDLLPNRVTALVFDDEDLNVVAVEFELVFP